VVGGSQPSGVQNKKKWNSVIGKKGLNTTGAQLWDSVEKREGRGKIGGRKKGREGKRKVVGRVCEFKIHGASVSYLLGERNLGK